MGTQELFTLIINGLVPAAILVIIIWKGFPILNTFVTIFKERNGEIRELVLSIKDLVDTIKERRW